MAKAFTLIPAQSQALRSSPRPNDLSSDEFPVLVPERSRARRFTREPGVPAPAGVRGGANRAPSATEPSGRSDRFRTAAEYASMLVQIRTKELNCSWTNCAWQVFTGRTRTELSGDGWIQLLHPLDRERCLRAWREASRTIRPHRVDYRVRRKDGSYASVLEIGTPRFTKRGVHVGQIALAVEVGETRNGFEGLTQEAHRALDLAQAEFQRDGTLDRPQQRLQPLAAELQQAEERERRRLALDLHDGLSQTIALARLKLAELRRCPGQSAQGALDGIDELIAQASRSVRAITFELNPPVLHEQGLEPALQSLVCNIGERYGIRIVFQDDGQPKPADEATRTMLFRATRELLINAAKHAHAQLVQVRVERDGAEIQVAVQDDGAGMRPESITGKGFGLFSIRERLEHAGGFLSIDSSPGRGATIRMRAPLARGPQLREQVYS